MGAYEVRVVVSQLTDNVENLCAFSCPPPYPPLAEPQTWDSQVVWDGALHIPEGPFRGIFGGRRKPWETGATQENPRLLLTKGH